MSPLPGLRWLRLHPFAAALAAAGLVALSVATFGWARLASAQRRHRELKAAAEMQTRPLEERGPQELEAIARELMRRLPPRKDLESWRGALTELAAKFSLKIPDIRMEDSPVSPSASPACSADKSPSPNPGSGVCSAAIRCDQNDIGSLSAASSDSQAEIRPVPDAR